MFSPLVRGKRKAVTGSRLPVLLENAPAPPSPRDEAASDPPSPEAIGPVPHEGPQVEGGIGSEDSMSVSLPGESMDVPTETSTDLPFVKSWANRKYEEGPPVLHPDQLRKLDEAMDRVELNRLVAMGVLRPMTEEENLERMTNLQSKYVRDWRFRPGEDGKTCMELG